MPNGGRIDFQVGFKTDKSGINQLKQTLQTLQNSLNFQQSKNGLNDQFQQASKAAKELQTILNDSWNSKLGQLNLDKVNAGIKKSYNSVGDLKKALSGAGAEGRVAFNQLATQILHANTQIKEGNALLNDFADTFGKTVKYGIASSIFNNIKNSLQQAFYFAKDLDLSLTNIRIVTGDSADQMERFSRTANQAAKNLGRSTLDYTNAALTFYQQGLGEEEVNARTQATMMAQNITGVGTEMADYLTAVWNGYKVGAEEAVEYVDKLAAVADSSASDMSQLAIAMSKVASAANVMGVNSDQLNAQLATVIATTRQAPESIGTAFKTIYARLNDIKTGADGAEVSLGNYSGKLAQLGFNVFDVNGKLRDSGEVIEEIGNRWGELTREQQIYLAQVVGGTRQYSRLISLFDNWTMYTDMLNVSLNSQGTLLEKNSRYMDSVKAHMEQLNTEAERTYEILSDPSAIKATTDALTHILTLFNDLIEGLGGGITAFSYFGSVVVGIFNKQIARAIDDTGQKLMRTFSQKAMRKFIQDVTDNVKLQRSASGDYKRSGFDTFDEQASAIAAAEEAQIYKKMLTVQKGLTVQQQKRYIQIQKEIGVRTNDLELLKQHRDMAREIIGNSQATVEQIKEQVKERKKALDAASQARSSMSELLKQQQQRDLNNRETAKILKEIQNIEQSTSISIQQRQQLQIAAEKLRKNEKLDEADISAIVDGLIIREKAQQVQVQKTLKLLDLKKRALNGEVEAQEQLIRLLKEEAKGYDRSGQHNIKIQKAVMLASALGQALSAAAGTAKVFWDENSTGAEKANAAFSGLQGVISSVGTALTPILGPKAMIITTVLEGVLSFVREMPGVKNLVESFFTSSAEAMQKTRKLLQETQDSIKVNRKGWSELKSIEDEYEALISKSGKLSSDEKTRLTQLAEKFAQYSDDVIVGYDLQGQAIVDKNQHIKNGLDDLDTEYEKIQRNAKAQLDLNSLDSSYNEAIEKADAAWEDSGVKDKTLKGKNDLDIATVNLGNQYPELGARLNAALNDVFSLYNQGIENYDLEKLEQAQSLLKEKIFGGEDTVGVLSSSEDIKALAQRTGKESHMQWAAQKEALEANSYDEILFKAIEDAVFNLQGSLQHDIEGLREVEEAAQQVADVSSEAVRTYIQGSDTFQDIRKTFSGQDWNDWGEDFWSEIVTSLSTNLEKTRDMSSTEDFGEHGIQVIQNLVDNLLNPNLLKQTLDQKDKEIQDIVKKQGFISIKQEADIIRKYAQQYLKAINIDKILEQAASEEDGGENTRTALQKLLKFFGLDVENLNNIGQGQTSAQQRVAPVVDKIFQNLNKAVEQGKTKYQPSQEDKNSLLNEMLGLNLENFSALQLAVDNLDFSQIEGIDDITKQLKALSKEADGAKEELEALSVDDTIKFFDKLREGKSYNKITGADKYIQDLEEDNPQLRNIALSEPKGRRDEDYIALAQQTALQRFQRKEREAHAAYKQAQHTLQTTEFEQGSQSWIELSNNVADAEDGWLAAKEALQLFTESLKDNQDTVKSLAETLKEQRETYNDGLAAYDNMYLQKDLTDDQYEALEMLESQNESLASLTRGSQEYLAVLREILITTREQAAEENLRNIHRLDQEKQILQKKIQNYQQELLNAKSDKEKEFWTTKIKEAQELLNKKVEEENELKKNTLDSFTKEYDDLSKIQRGVSDLSEKLKAGNALNLEQSLQFEKILTSIEQKFPELIDLVETLRDTGLAGTEQYNAALDELQDKLSNISLDSALTELQHSFDTLSQDVTIYVEVDETQFQQWKKDLDNFLSQDRKVSIAIDNAVKEEFNSVKADMAEIYEAASKIGQNFIVAANDVGALAKAFPGITQGMQALANGSFQLNQQAVQQTIGLAKTEVSANAEAMMAKMKNEADFFRSKAAIYRKMAAIAHEFATGEVTTEEQKNQKIGQLNDNLNQLREMDEQAVAEFSEKMDDATVQSKEDTATQVVAVEKTEAEKRIDLSNTVADVSVANQNNIALAKRNSAQGIDTPRNASQNGASSVGGIGTEIKAPAMVEIGADGVTRDVFDQAASQFEFYNQQDWQKLENKLNGQVQLYESLADTVEGNIYALQGQANKTLFGLDNVAGGYGINGPKEEKQKQTKEKQPAKPSVESYLKEEFDRYHDINIIIQKINRQLKIMESEQKKLVGKDLINNYQKQLDLLNQQIEAQKQKMSIAQQEAGELRGMLSAQGVGFYENGQISNYLGVLSSKQNAINSYISYYNSLTKEEQEYAKGVLDSMKEEYDDLKKNISRYDELINNMIPDLADQIREETQKKVEIAISKSKMAVDIKIDLSQLQRDYNKFIKNIKKQVQDWDILGNTKFAFKDLQSFFKGGIYNSTKAQTEQLYFLMDQIRQINQSGFSSVYGDNKKQALDDLSQYRESLEGDLQSVLDLIEQIKQNIIKAIEQVQEGFENRQKYYDHISGLLDHDLKLVELIYGDKAYQKMQNLYKMQYENDLKHLADLREEEQYWDKQLQQEREHQKNLEKDSNAWHESQERIKKFEQNWMDATNRLNSAFSSSIQNIINEYQTGIEKIYHDLELQLFNGHSFEYIQQEWELAKKQSDMYLDNINRSYALDKLNNGYDKLSEKTKGNLKAQRQINAAREAELSSLRQKEKITQGQMDVATRRLQILEMQIALEDSRNNKSTLQLRRDSQGNYSYQYAADEDDTADKLQQIKDAQNELYNFTKNLKTQAYDEIPRLYQQMANKIIQIDRQMYLSDEEKMELRKLTHAKYMDLINKQAQIAKDTDIMYSKEALSAITDGSDYSYRSVFDPETGKVTTYLGYGEKSVEQWAEDNKGIMDRMMQYLEEEPYAKNKQAFYNMIYGNDDSMLPTWKKGVGQFIDKIIGAGGLQPLMQEAMDKLQQQVEDYRTKFDNLADAADIDTDRIGEGVDIDIEKTQELIGTNEEMLQSYQNVYDEMINYWIPTLENYIDKHRELKEAIDAITEAYKLQMQEQRRAAEAATQVAGAAAVSTGDTSLFDGTYNQVHPDVSYGGGYSGDTVVINPSAYGGGGGFSKGDRVRFLYGRYTGNSQGGDDSGDASLGQYVTITYVSPGAPRPYHISGADYQGNYSDLGWVSEDQLGYRSGGYTGDWNSPDGKWALLHQKELVLNTQDTENILSAVNIVRSYNDALNKLQDYQNELLFGNGISSIYSNRQQTPIEQIVHINADFPAVRDYREIELAFKNLANRASQYLFTSR